MFKSQYAFIMGPPRSGTTAITRFLMSHSDALLADRELLDPDNLHKPTYESGIFTRPLSDEDILERFRKIDGRAPLIFEKTPSHIFHVQRIRMLFPGCRFIICHREPLGCMLSWKVATRKFIEKGGSFNKGCRNWARSTNEHIQNMKSVDVITVDFQDLTNSTEKVGRDLLTALDLDLVELPKCLTLMNDKSLERVKHMVGESLTRPQQRTELNVAERIMVRMICKNTEERWQKAAETI